MARKKRSQKVTSKVETIEERDVNINEDEDNASQTEDATVSQERSSTPIIHKKFGKLILFKTN